MPRPLSPREKRLAQVLWWLFPVSAGLAILAYVLGYPAGTQTVAYGITWPLISIFWAKLFRDTLRRHGEWP